MFHEFPEYPNKEIQVKTPNSLTGNESSTTEKYIYKIEEPLEPKTIIGDKGVNLARAAKIGCPIPEFVIIKSNVQDLPQKHKIEIISHAIKELELQTGKNLNDNKNPLIISIRGVCANYIPGYLDTGLCLGLTKEMLPALGKLYSQPISHKIYIKMLETILRFIDMNDLECVMNSKADSNYIDLLEERINKYNPDLLKDPLKQIIHVVFYLYNDFSGKEEDLSDISKEDSPKLAIIFQRMVFSSAGLYGVLNTRDPDYGEGLHLFYHETVFGDEIMTGDITPKEKHNIHPKQFFEIHTSLKDFVYEFKEKLEREFRDGLTMEFVIEKDKFYLLQVNHLNKSPQAGFIIAYNLLDEGIISKDDLDTIITPLMVKRIEEPSDYGSDNSELHFLGKALSVLPRRMTTGRIYFSKDTLFKAIAEKEKNVIICQDYFDPAQDLPVQEKSCGILTLHNAVVHTRQYALASAKPCLYNLTERAGLRFQNGCLVAKDGTIVKEGDFITISSKKASLYLGKATLKTSKFMSLFRGEDVIFDSPSEKAYLNRLLISYKRFKEYINSKEVSFITEPFDLYKHIQKLGKEEKQKVKDLVNTWVKNNFNLFFDYLLNLEFDEHTQAAKIFSELNFDNIIEIFKKAAFIKKENAGLGFLGRILSEANLEFWNIFADHPEAIAYFIGEKLFYMAYCDLRSLHGDRGRNIKHALRTTGIKQENVHINELYVRKEKDLLMLRLSNVDLDKVIEISTGQTKILLQYIRSIKPEDFSEYQIRRFKEKYDINFETIRKY